MLANIALDVGTALFIFFVGRFSPLLVSWVKYWRAKRFWWPIARSRPTVVVGRHELPEWEASGLIGVGDAKGIEELRKHFRRLHMASDFAVRSVDELPLGMSYDGTFVCVGGPDAVPGQRCITAEMWRRAPTSFVWADPSDHVVAVIDRQTGRAFEPQGLGGTEMRDYALIVSMPNPYSNPDTRHHVVLFAGCFGFGTWGAVRFATTPTFVKDDRIRGDSAFECLLSIEVANRAPARTDIIEVRPLQLDTAE